MRATESPDVYWHPVRERIPALLSLLDREPFSTTYGLFDRTFWCWKFTDFPASRMQEAVAALAMLRDLEAPGNALRGAGRLLEWIEAGLLQWCALQHGDGSLDEAYPYERSLAATAFTAFYVAEAVERVGGELPAASIETVSTGLRRAGEWLSGNDESHGFLSNHQAAAAAALVHIARLTGDARFAARAQFFLDKIIARQSPEGWYEEYGGADPGYQSHGMFYLTRIWALTGDERLRDSLERGVAFLAADMHPDGSIGGAYASRNTEFLFPAAFEILAGHVPGAARLARKARHALATGAAVGLPAMDIWNLLPMMNNYLFALGCASDRDEDAGEADRLPGVQAFPEAGWLVQREKGYHGVLGASKGGVVQVWGAGTGGPVFSDCGYWVRFADGKTASSQSFDRGRGWRREGEWYVVRADFVMINRTLMRPWLFVAFRLFMLTLGRFRRTAEAVKRLLVRVLIRRKAPTALSLERRVRFAGARVDVEDILRTKRPVAIAELGMGSKFATVHMGSSRYFRASELAAGALDDHETLAGAARDLGAGREVRLARSWPAPICEPGR